MSKRQTVLFACLLSMVFSASAHNDFCSAGTRAVVIGSFNFTPAQLLQAQKTHNPDTCPLRIEGQVRGVASTQRLQSSIQNSNKPLAAQPNVPIGDGGPPPMCGVVDGENHHLARVMMMSRCNEQATSKGTAAASALKQGHKVAFRVRTPRSYNAADHHANYQFSDGNLVGACYVCVPIRAIDVVVPRDQSIKAQEAIQPKK
jgi:hypothetical protein